MNIPAEMTEIEKSFKDIFFYYFSFSFILFFFFFAIELLDVNPSSDVCALHDVSHSMGCVFTLLTASCAVRKHFSWHSATCPSVSVLVTCVFSDISKKSLPRAVSGSFPLRCLQEFYRFVSRI